MSALRSGERDTAHGLQVPRDGLLDAPAPPRPHSLRYSTRWPAAPAGCPSVPCAPPTPAAPRVKTLPLKSDGVRFVALVASSMTPMVGPPPPPPPPPAGRPAPPAPPAPPPAQLPPPPHPPAPPPPPPPRPPPAPPRHPSPAPPASALPATP